MADAMVECRPPARFYCHRCLVEFRDFEQNCTCPYCESGFIEQLEADPVGRSAQSRVNNSDANIRNTGDNVRYRLRQSAQPNTPRRAPPLGNDIPFLMTGARMRATIPRIVSRQPNRTANVGVVGAAPAPPSGNPRTNPAAGRNPTLIEELLWMISGGRPPAGATTAGTPFVVVGTPGDYVFGGEGLDDVVTQLLGQLEYSGPPPLPRERLEALPTEQVSEEMARANIACSVCWDNFLLGETISRLECEHVFHRTCITPWLELHATCPICRRSLLPPAAAAAAAATFAAAAAATVTAAAATAATAATTTTTTTTSATYSGSTATSTASTTSATTAPSTPFTAPRFVDPQIRLRRGRQSGILVNATPRIVIQRRMGPVPTFIRRLASQTHIWDSLNNTSSSSTISPASSVTTGGVWTAQNRPSNSTGSTNSSSSLNSNDRDRQYNTDIDYD